MANENQTVKKKMNPILWVLFAIIIPLIIVIVLIGVVLGIAGFNVIDWAKEKGSNIPVISSMVPSEEVENRGNGTERMNSLLTSKEEEIEQLSLEINNLETNITELEQELLKQNASEQAEVAEAGVAPTSEENPSNEESVKQVVKSFEEMDSANAAAIMGHMDGTEVIVILQALSNEVRGEILQEMGPEDAAEFTRLLMNE